MINLEDLKDQLKKAPKLREDRQFQTIVDICDQIIAIEESYFDAYRFRGQALYRLKEYDRAIEDLNTQIKLNPQHLSAYFYRGQYNLERRKFKLAIEDFDFVINTKEEWFLSTAHFFRLFANLKLGNKMQALEDYAKLPSDFSFRVKFVDEGGKMYTKTDLFRLIPVQKEICRAAS